MLAFARFDAIIRLRSLSISRWRSVKPQQQSCPVAFQRTEAFGEKTSPLDLHETEKRLIAQALAATNGNITAAAKKLGISRRTLHRKLNEMKLAKTKPDGDSGS